MPEILAPAEINILNSEMAYRAHAQTMKEYLNMFVPKGELMKVENPNLFRKFLERS